MTTTRRALLCLLCVLTAVGLVGRGAWLDPDLQALRSDYMSTWRPAHLDGEMRYEHPADTGPLGLGGAAVIERRLSFASAEFVTDAIAEALAAADSHGWTPGRGNPRPTDTRSRLLEDGRRATLDVVYPADVPSTLVLRIEVR